MRIAKWGNSLAVRLPVELAQRLGVKEGEELLARVSEITDKFPADFEFDRDAANARR